MLAHARLAVLIAPVAVFAAAASTHAAQITPVSQLRSITADSIVSPIGQQDIEFLSATNFNLFDKSANAAVSNANAVSDTAADQQSDIDTCSLIGIGSSFAHSKATANGFHGYSIGVSTCRLTFDLDEPTDCLIAGTLNGGLNSHANVILQRVPNTLIVMRSVTDGSLGVHHRSRLEPGRYTITFDSISSTASNGSGELETAGSFDMIFTLCFEPADVTVDGTVDVDDLLTVINAWGKCPSEPESCAADIDLNSLVDVDDLLAVINAWGS